MNEIIEEDKVIVEDMIYEIRGKQVMFDSDLAKLYHVETKQLNRQVKRNIERFDDDFCFELTKEELEILSSRRQFGTLNNSNRGRGHNIKYLPYVFTEQGVAMLTSVLHSEIAIRQSKRIIRAFVAMRHYNVKESIIKDMDKILDKNQL